MKKLLLVVLVVGLSFFENNSLAQSCNPILDVRKKLGSTYAKMIFTNEWDDIYTDMDGNTVTDHYADVTVEFYADYACTIPKSVTNFKCDFRAQGNWTTWDLPYIQYENPNSYPARNGFSFTEVNQKVNTSVVYALGGSFYYELIHGLVAGDVGKQESCVSAEGRLYLSNGTFQFVNNATWYRDGIVVPGITAGFYNTNIQGNYQVSMPGGSCGGTQTTPLYNYLVTNGCDVILPLKIISFNAVKVGICSYKVDWVLDDAFEATKLNIIGIDKNNVEISLYEESGVIKSINNKNINVTGITTIKLVLIDFSGKTINSRTVIINSSDCSPKNKFSAFITNESNYLKGENIKNDIYTIEFITNSGQKIYSYQKRLSGSVTELIPSIWSLKNQIIFLKVCSQNSVESFKILGK
jgi:hypothetical protein